MYCLNVTCTVILEIAFFEKATISAHDFMTFSNKDKMNLLFTYGSLVSILANTCLFILQRRKSNNHFVTNLL